MPFASDTSSSTASRGLPRAYARMGNLAPIGLGLALGLGIGLSACSAPTKAAAPPTPPEVVVAEVRPRDVPLHLELIGTLDGMVNAEIRARVPGYINTQDVRDGAFVKKGQLLFTIDPALPRADASRASGVVELSRAALAKALVDVNRLRPLAAAGAVSKQELDNAVASAEEARARLNSAAGDLAHAGTTLGYSRVTSPIDGLVGISKVRVGTLVGQGEATLLTTVSQIDPIRVTFAVSEQEYLANADAIRHLGGLELILADGSVHPHKGEVAVIDRVVDPTTGTIAVQAIFPNPEGILRPGLFGKVRGVREVKKDALLVPQRAVAELQGTWRLSVVGPGDVVEVRVVGVGERVGTEWIIEHGLAAGERIIVEGLQKAKNGAKVSPRVASAALAPTTGL